MRRRELEDLYGSQNERKCETVRHQTRDDLG